ncbi:hypothetical protein K933_09901 [Candidatus Halobonum tyrrellensis G22]|uniref:HTH marR-type domain-containing protein n=1 Tax=Candidatus Halobonum tyrrellensis G22 TaxID=1324957 RepID=V4IYR2_9EURY|nr:hypothetical protein K933_09901 [Candidatus Halobonum tyrrellensis G22]
MEVADVLAKRHRCLRALTEGPRAKRDLVAALDIPRTTLDRAVRELVDAGLAERSEGGHRATVFGREALDAHERYRSRLDGLAAGADLLAALPSDTPLGGAFLDGATVTESTPAAPDRVLDSLLTSVDGTGRFMGVAPVAITGHLETFYATLTDETGDRAPRLVVGREVFDHVLDVQGGMIRERLGNDSLHLRVGPIPFRFGLWVVDDREAGVVVYTDTGVRGVAINDTEEAIAWARDLHDGVWADSTRVTFEMLDDGDADVDADTGDDEA